MDDAQPRRIRREACRVRGTEGVLLLAQVADDADVEGPPGRIAGRTQRQRRLMDDSELPPEPQRQIGSHEVVQADEPIRCGHRGGGLLGVAVPVAVDVGAGHEHDEGARGIPVPERGDRGRAPPGVNGDEEVGAFPPARGSRDFPARREGRELPVLQGASGSFPRPRRAMPHRPSPNGRVPPGCAPSAPRSRGCPLRERFAAGVITLMFNAVSP